MASNGNDRIASDQLFQNFINQTPFTCQIHTPDGQLIDSNPAFSKLYSLDEKALQGLYENYNILNDEQAVNRGLMPYVKRVFAGEFVSFPPYEYDTNSTLDDLDIQKVEHNIGWIKSHGFPLRDAHGKITHVAFLSEDITASKLAEQAARENWEKFEDLFEQSPLTNEIYNLDGVLIYANSAFEKLWHIKREKVIGNFNLLKSEQVKSLGLTPYFERVFSGETIELPDVEFDASQEAAAMGQGQKRWISNLLYPVKDASGNVTHVVMIHEDLTDRKLAEKELHDTRLFSDNLIQSANVMIVGIDIEGKVNIFNPAAERISGYTYAELKDKDWFSTLVPKHKYPYVHKEFSRLVHGGIPKLFKNPILTKNGEERIISWTTNEVIKDNKPAGIISFGVDVTDQEIAEKELRQSEKRYRTLFTGSSNGIVFVDTKTKKFKYANPAIARMLGYTQEELCKIGIGDIHPPDSLQLVYKEFEAQIKGESNFIQALPCLRKDKQIIYANVSATVLHTPEGEFSVGFFTDVTEHIKSELSLKASENKFRALFNEGGYAMSYAKMEDGLVLMANQACLDLFGAMSDEVLNKKASNFIAPEERARVEGYARLRLTSKAPNYYITRGLRKDGSTFDLEIRMHLFEMDGEKYGLAMMNDISDRVKAEEERNRMFDLSVDLIGVAGFDGSLKQINPAWEAILGYSVHEFESKLIFDFIHHEDIEKTYKEVEKLALGYKTIDFENRYIDKSGEIHYISWTATPLVSEENIYCIGRDITENKLAEIALQESEEKFRLLVEQSPLAILIFNPDGSLDQVNEAWQKMWSISDEDLQKVLDYYNILTDEEGKKNGYLPLIQRAFKGEPVVLPLQEYDGKESMDNFGQEVKVTSKWTQVSCYPVKNKNGEVIKVVNTVEDFTDRKLWEEESLNYQKRLQKLALELTYAEEKQRKEIATDLHDDVGQLLASSRMQIAAIDPSMDKSDILESMTNISSGLLDAIHATRRAIFELSPPQLNEIGLGAALADWMEEEVEARHGIKSVIIGEERRFQISNEIRYLLFRCMRELLINVIKHAQATKIVIQFVEENDVLEISVEDNGIGFDYKSDSENLNLGGFGLFSIKERIQNIGGSINIQSELGAGTKIKLFLPLVKN